MNDPHVCFVTRWSCGWRVEFGDEIGPAGRKSCHPARLFRSARRARIHVDEHDRQAVTAERRGEHGGASHHVPHGMDGRQRNDTFLQIDDDERGFRVDDGNGHARGFRVIRIAAQGAPVFMTRPGA